MNLNYYIAIAMCTMLPWKAVLSQLLYIYIYIYMYIYNAQTCKHKVIQMV